MKHHVFTIVASLALGFGLVPDSHAIEILRWQRLPLAVPLVVGQERVVFIDRNVRVGLPPSLGERLRVQSAGGAIYLRASEAIAPTRLQLQDVESGAIVLVDIAATDAGEGEQPLEPVRIVLQEAVAEASGDTAAGPTQAAQPARRRQTPITVVLTRYAAQNLYAPLRTVEPVAGIGRVPLAAWRLEDQWVTAVRLTNTSPHRIDLDPRVLQGDFVAATFQHPDLGPAGASTDTTVVYLVTRGRGLAESLMPVLSPIDAGTNLPPAAAAGRTSDEE